MFRARFQNESSFLRDAGLGFQFSPLVRVLFSALVFFERALFPVPLFTERNGGPAFSIPTERFFFSRTQSGFSMTRCRRMSFNFFFLQRCFSSLSPTFCPVRVDGDGVI